MIKKGIFLSGAATVAIFGAWTAPAAARVTHRQAAVSPQEAEIRELRAQVQELTTRLDAQEEAQRSTQAQADAAQTQAVAAATQAQAAQTAAVTASTSASTQVADAVAKLPKPKPGWFDNTSISGRAYFNVSSISQQANGVDTAAKGVGFNIKRFYLGIDHKFDDTFSANLTTDISNVVGSTSNGNFPAGSANLIGRGLYVKKAYLQAKISPALIIRAGSADLPWVPYVEGQYGYRHIENTLIDRTSFGTSADWGLHVLGDLAGGLLSYQVSVVDGGGYRNVKVTQSVDVEGRLSAQYKGFYGAVGGYTGKRAQDVAGVVTPHTATRLDALVGYKDKTFTVGGEYFASKNWNNVATLTEDKAQGYSIFGSVNFMPKLSAFGRYDWVKPSDDLNDALRDHYFNVGVQYEPVKIVDIALVYKRDVADNGLIGTTNGTIGGPNPTGLLIGGRGTYDEIGLFGQFRF